MYSVTHCVVLCGIMVPIGVRKGAAVDGDMFFRRKESVGERGGDICQIDVGVGFGITAGPGISAGHSGSLECRWSMDMEISTLIVESI